MQESSQNYEVELEVLARILTWDHQKEITPLQILIAYQMHVLTKVPFKECIKAAYEAEKIIKKK